VTLRELALAVVAAYDHRFRDELCMMAFCQAVERLRKVLEAPFFSHVPPASEPETLVLELQAMTHVSAILGALPKPARFRTLIVVALAMAPEVFSGSEYAKLIENAKGGQRPSSPPGSSSNGSAEQVRDRDQLDGSRPVESSS
jgi:hypothetical protein